MKKPTSATTRPRAILSATWHKQRWRRRRTRSRRLSRARATSFHGQGRRCSRGSSRASWGETQKGWEEGEWMCSSSSIDVEGLGGSGGSWRLGAHRGGVGGVGGFPPSTLGAWGGRRQGRGPGGLDWAKEI